MSSRWFEPPTVECPKIAASDLPFELTTAQPPAEREMIDARRIEFNPDLTRNEPDLVRIYHQLLKIGVTK